MQLSTSLERATDTSVNYYYYDRYYECSLDTLIRFILLNHSWAAVTVVRGNRPAASALALARAAVVGSRECHSNGGEPWRFLNRGARARVATCSVALVCESVALRDSHCVGAGVGIDLVRGTGLFGQETYIF